jgi:hypothetical protein
MNLILIDLRQYNHIKISELAQKFDWNAETLLSYKTNDVAQIWVDVDTKQIIAYNMKKDPKVRIHIEFVEQLTKMESFQLTKKPKVFNLDSILEKISTKGINSLNSEEKNYLDNLNK